jgi:hypothetical protein
MEQSVDVGGELLQLDSTRQRELGLPGELEAVQ